jgi:teichuronic acid exporter
MSAKVSNIKHKAFSGIVWTLIDRLGSQTIGFVITIVLARLLTPKEFGLVAMTTVFLSISRIFIDGGLKDSLIQKKDATSTDYNTVFVFNLLIGIIAYVLLFFCAPAIALFYKEPELTLIVRIVGIQLLMFPLCLVQVAIINRELKFKTLVKIRVPSTLASGIIGLILAYMGYGVYALVAQIALEGVFFVIILWMVFRWTPSWEFDRETFRFHWKHGSRLLVVDLMTALYRNIFSLIIGKFFSATQLGFYNRADTFKVFIYNNTVGIMQTVSYPILAQVQDDDVKLKHLYKKIFQSTFLVILPVLGFMIIFAKPFIEFLLTDKWLSAAHILSVLAAATILSPFNSINLNILKVKRRTDLMLRAEMWNKGIVVLIVLVTAILGFDYLIYSNLLLAIISLFLNNFFTNKIFKYSLIEQIKDLRSIFISFTFSMAIVFALDHFFTKDLLSFYQLLIGGVTLMGSYFLSIFVMNRSLIFSLADLVKPKNKLENN